MPCCGASPGKKVLSYRVLNLFGAVPGVKRSMSSGKGVDAGGLVLCRPYVQTWAQQHLPAGVTEGSRAYLVGLFEEHVDAGLAWIRSQGSEYMPSVDIALVTSLASLVQVLLLVPA